MNRLVSVAMPVRNGGLRLREVRVFDEFRVLREVLGHREPLSPGLISAYQPRRKLGRSGTDADRLAADLRGWSSLEGRTSFEPTALS